MPALTRIGHKGADLIAPGNTLASFDAALADGVDMVEFDVLPENPDGQAAWSSPTTSRTPGAAPRSRSRRAWTTSPRTPGGVELDVDLKTHGYEERVIAALREHGLAERTLISTMEVVSLPILRAPRADVRLGWSVPKLRRNYLANPLRAGRRCSAPVLRRTLPRARRAPCAPGRDRRRHVALLARHAALRARRRARRRRALRLDGRRRDADPPSFERMGVTGVITNDPRLFATA